MANCIITIGRQCGSGGHTIGKLVAQRLETTIFREDGIWRLQCCWDGDMTRRRQRDDLL